ncbi:DUF4175 family protein [Anaeromyxobacter diazotrophicus]|uniref:DUF4175 family protein n=1 Tax=Anaeromyxobacter diazotrophicus TaxID=2590199 RepID=A0A7I9VMH7_9BACT|nr:DUF4175 family protein [Anaeromyxobacter diazotrophicus]GEJ57604.1 hypothetical protein AMYX_23450 [Anaeromyxobacter diazotrophicus]
MAIAYSEIARVLDGARRRQGWVVLATAAGGALCAVLLVGLGGAALLGAGVGRPTPVRAAALAAAALVALSALAWAAVAAMRRASSPLAVARRVGEAAPELRSDLVSSVELEDDYEEVQRTGRYSVALVDAHIARTAERARGLDLARVIPARPARRAGAALAAAALVNLVALAAAPRVLAAGWQRLLGLGPAAPVRRAEPITGDVEVSYVYPAYMHREPRTISGTGGEISAPRGTEVTLKTRADREVQRAELALESAARKEGPAVYALTVANRRDLEGHLTVDVPGAYRFRFLKGKKLVAEGPPIALAVEPDAPPEVRITAPAPELEVDARARVRIEWAASDDFGLEKLTLVTKPPGGDERRTQLKAFAGTRRESGVHELELAPLRLAEGEKLLYWLEAEDGDVVSGPKRGASATHTLKIYSEAEHHRLALLRAQGLWEDMVKLLGDRLDFFEGGPRWTDERTQQAQALDGRTRELHEGLRAAAQELRKDRSVPRQLPQALANAAAGIRPIEQDLAALRLTLSRMLHFQRAGASPLFDRVAEVDGRLDRELEKDVLYLEQLFDQQRADDLVKVAKDLAARRRDLAQLLEKYKQAPSEAAKKELLAEVARMKARMAEMMRRMGELAKGMNDEHMNREALAELARSKDAMGGLDEVEKKLAQGDVEGAMKALDQLGNAMQDMLASLERTAGRPGEQNAALMKDMLAFKKELEEVKASQEQVARETEQVKGQYQQRLAQKLKQLEAGAKQLEGLAAEARRELDRAEPGVTPRSEDEFGQARDRLADLQKALAAKDLDAALETVRRALPPMQRLAMDLGDEASMGERYRALRSKDPRVLREAERHASGALGPTRKVRDELEKMFPDPKSVLGPKEQQRLSELSQEQGQLEQRAGELRQKLSELAQRAPVFPPQSQEMLEGSQGHMQRARGELAQKNAQRGHGEQRQALDDLSRFQRGLDEMAKNAKRGQGGGGGFPFPFGEEQGGREGDGADPSQEKVEIPGADAFKAPDEFRKDLLEAMKQGTPEPYQGEVKRYYEELVK